jgi:hypothetical protein
MDTTLVLIGVGCIIGAIIGGGLKLTTVMEMGALESLWRQILLGAFGVCLVLFGLVQGGSISLPSPAEAPGAAPEGNGNVAISAMPAPSPSANATTAAVPAQPQAPQQEATPVNPKIAPSPSEVSASAAPPEKPRAFDYSGPWLDQYQQKVAIVQSGESVNLQWHDGNQTVRIVGAVDERGQFLGESDVANRRSCNGGFQEGTHIGIVCRGDPGINNWTFRLLRASP